MIKAITLEMDGVTPVNIQNLEWNVTNYSHYTGGTKLTPSFVKITMNSYDKTPDIVNLLLKSLVRNLDISTYDVNNILLDRYHLVNARIVSYSTSVSVGDAAPSDQIVIGYTALTYSINGHSVTLPGPI